MTRKSAVWAALSGRKGLGIPEGSSHVHRRRAPGAVHSSARQPESPMLSQPPNTLEAGLGLGRRAGAPSWVHPWGEWKAPEGQRSKCLAVTWKTFWAAGDEEDLSLPLPPSQP